MSKKQLLGISRACMVAILFLVFIAFKSNFRVSGSPYLAGIIMFLLAAVMNVTNVLAGEDERWKQWKWYYWLPNLFLPFVLGIVTVVFLR